MAKLHKCAECGSGVRRGVGKDRRGNLCENVFCNRRCYDSFRANIAASRTAVCIGCGDRFTHQGGRVAKYCTWDCRVLSKKARPRTCLNCNCVFTPVGPINRDGAIKYISKTTGKTCSPECAKLWLSNNEVRKEKISAAFAGSNHPNWRGGLSQLNNISNRGIGWQGARKRALVRDKYICVDCGISNGQSLVKYGRGLDVDHIVPFHNFIKHSEANCLDNLECRCASCHRKAEAKRVGVQMCLPFGVNQARRHAGYRVGENHPKAKLRAIEVVDIRKMAVAGIAVADIAAKYGITKPNVSSIVQRVTWKRLM